MTNGMVIEATTPSGAIKIAAGPETIRSYTWAGETRSARLWARPERWLGSRGLYYPAPVEHWAEHHGVTRGVLEEGCQHFSSVDEAVRWLNDPALGRFRFVYRNDGLVVGWFTSPERKAVNISVWQIYIGGNKPTALPGAGDSAVTVRFATRPSPMNREGLLRFPLFGASSGVGPTVAREADLCLAEKREDYEQAIAALKGARNEIERFHALGAAAKRSLDFGRRDEAIKYAKELQAAMTKHEDDWGYGNAVQDVNIVLGRVALANGFLEEAKQRLIAAGRSPGSPQMNSFGPNLSLAKELLRAGEKEVVLQYFDLCKKFWKTDFGRLQQWSEEVSEGRIPDFGPNISY